jgi:hypothetical protein
MIQSNGLTYPRVNMQAPTPTLCQMNAAQLTRTDIFTNMPRRGFDGAVRAQSQKD